MLGERAVVEVTRHRLDPRVPDADDRLGEVLRGEPDGAEHRARGRAIRSFCHHRAVPLAALRAAGVHVRRECIQGLAIAGRMLLAVLAGTCYGPAMRFIARFYFDRPALRLPRA